MRTTTQLYFLPYLMVLLFVPLQLLASTRGISVVSKEGKSLYLYKDYYALVVGVSDYDYWPDLQGVEDDVRETTKALGDFGFNVSMLLNPTSRELREKLNSLAYELGREEDRAILFYYSGHGETETLATGEKLGYIIPKDCPILNQDLIGFGEKAISMNVIETYALRIKSKHVLMLFDSCFSGSVFASLKSVPSDISEKSNRPVRQFITAGNEDEQVPDDSIFNTVLIQGINGDADYNVDGYVTGSELGMYLDTSVVNYSQGSQHPQYGRIRHPKLDKGDFIFVLDGNDKALSKSTKEENEKKDVKISVLSESVVNEEQQQKETEDGNLEEERKIREEKDRIAVEAQRLEKERRLIEEEWRHLEEEAGNNLSAADEISRIEMEMRKRKNRLDEEERKLEEERGLIDKEWGELEKEKTFDKVKEYWSKWQQRLASTYNQAKRYDENPNISARDKTDKWQNLISDFKQDNPYSTEDERIRNYARRRLEYWNDFQKRDEHTSVPPPPRSLKKPPPYVRDFKGPRKIDRKRRDHRR